MKMGALSATPLHAVPSTTLAKTRARPKPRVLGKYESYHPPCKPPGRWAKPLLAIGDRIAYGLLRMRGYRHRRVKTRDGVMHALVCEGKGKMPPLVVLPGLGTHVTDYLKVLWSLKTKFRRVVAIDLPNHGESRLHKRVTQQRFARAIMDTKIALAPEPSFMLGHSLGALGTMTSYAAAPHQITSMALVTPPGGPVSPAQIQQYTRKFDIHNWHDACVIADMNEPRDCCWPHLFSPAFLSSRLCVEPIRQLLGSDVLTRPVAPTLLAQLPEHTMFVWAGRERLLPREFRGYFLRHLPPTTRVWEPAGLSHGGIAWGGKNLKPIIRFFESAHRDLTAADPRNSTRRLNAQRLRQARRHASGGAGPAV